MKRNVVLSPASPGTAPAVEIGGFAPGATVHARFFLKDDLGRVTEAPDLVSFTTADFWWAEEFAPMVKASGSQCFDTGILPNRGTRVSFTHATTDKATDKMTFGERNNGFNFLCWIGTNPGTSINPCLGTSGNVGAQSTGKMAGERWTLDFGLLSGVWVDGVSILDAYWWKANYDSSATSSKTLYMMGLNDKGAIDNRKYVANATFTAGQDRTTAVRDASGRLMDDLARQVVDDILNLKW